MIDKLSQQLKKQEKSVQIKSLTDPDNIPRPLAFRGSRKAYTPELVAIYNSRSDLYSIEKDLPKKHISDLISKWILFGLEARNRRGRFYIVSPKKISPEIQSIINDKQLSAEVITV